MAYVVPQFPLAVGVWRYGSDVANPPDVVTTGNLVGGRSGIGVYGPILGNTGPSVYFQMIQTIRYMQLLVPALTDIQPPQDATGLFGDCVEVPGGSGRFYAVIQVDDIGKGFPNEHRFAMIVPIIGSLGQQVAGIWNCPLDWPVPIP